MKKNEIENMEWERVDSVRSELRAELKNDYLYSQDITFKELNEKKNKNFLEKEIVRIVNKLVTNISEGKNYFDFFYRNNVN